MIGLGIDASPCSSLSRLGCSGQLTFGWSSCQDVCQKLPRHSVIRSVVERSAQQRYLFSRLVTVRESGSLVFNAF